MKIYRGETVASGVALGRVHLQGFDEEAGNAPRIPSDQVEHELNRLRDALALSRAQIEEIRAKQESKLAPEELRIFDTHLAYLQDPMFIDEIEKQIMQERHAVRGAIHQVVSDYDRIFSLVESDHVRQRAGDFRDVGTRVLRNVDEAGRIKGAPRPEGRYILAAARLTTTDMFDLENDEVEGIVAEEGGISSHAAILARSMGIPTVTGIRDLPGKLGAGDLVVLDGGAGEMVVDPDPATIARYERSVVQYKADRLASPAVEQEHATRDGVEVRILGSCGSLGEARLARTYGMDGIGVYRTELAFLSEPREPTEEDLVERYREVVRQPGNLPVNIRLLDVGANTPVAGLAAVTERNPAMGQRGVRRLLRNSDLLRRQLRAILRAAAGSDRVAVLVPFVTGLSDLTRVKTAILEERQALRKRDVVCVETLQVAPILEVPAAAFVLSAFLPQSDFVVVALDDLQAHLLAADRDNHGVRDYYEMEHPAVFELLNRMAREAQKSEKRLVLFGEGAGDARRLPLYLGMGIRDFSVAPASMTGVIKVLRRYTIDECRKLVTKILQAPRSLDIERILVQRG